MTRLNSKILVVALCAGLSCTGAAAAQTDDFGSWLEPCIEPHFDPGRYLADLQSLGWEILGEGARDPALDALADAFAPIMVPGFAVDGSDATAVRAQQRADWEARTAGRNVLQRGEQFLHIGGDQNSDGRARVLCWVASPAGDETMAELWSIWESAGLTDQSGSVLRAAVPETPIDSGATFALFAASDTAAAEPPLAASQGLLMQMIQSAGGSSN